MENVRITLLGMGSGTPLPGEPEDVRPKGRQPEKRYKAYYEESTKKARKTKRCETDSKSTNNNYK